MTQAYEERQKIEQERNRIADLTRISCGEKIPRESYELMASVVKTLAWADWSKLDRIKFSCAFLDVCTDKIYKSNFSVIDAVRRKARQYSEPPIRKAFNYMALVLEQNLSRYNDNVDRGLTLCMGRTKRTAFEEECARYSSS